MPDDLDYSQLTPQRVLVLRYQLEDRLMSPGSMSGHQAERMRQGLGGAPPDGARPNTAESERAKLADLVLLCKGLTALQEAACRARYSGSVGVELYKRLRRPCDLREGDGEEVINARPDGHADLVEVQGRSVIYASYRRVGEIVGASEQAARYLVQTAISKIALEQFRRRRKVNRAGRL